VAQVLYPDEDAERVLRAWRDIASDVPDTVTPQAILWGVPPDPAIPAALHGRKAVIVMGLFAGPPEAGEAVLAPLRAPGAPLLEDALRGAVYGWSHDRLAAVRAAYDPEGLFEGAARRP
jgi:hypothetical protein